jgi:hypothetical protein
MCEQGSIYITFTYTSYLSVIQIQGITISCCKKSKIKSIPVIGCESLQGCETSRIPHYLDNRFTDGSKVVSLTHRPHFTTRYFLIFTSVRGWVNLGVMVRLERLGTLKKKLNCLIGSRTRRPSGLYGKSKCSCNSHICSLLFKKSP